MTKDAGGAPLTKPQREREREEVGESLAGTQSGTEHYSTPPLDVAPIYGIWIWMAGNGNDA